MTIIEEVYGAEGSWEFKYNQLIKDLNEAAQLKPINETIMLLKFLNDRGLLLS